jgi:hypothetical protein
MIELWKVCFCCITCTQIVTKVLLVDGA